MKIIFLDIDGVLNWAGTEDRLDGFVGLCQERISRLNKITDAVPDAKIVISSTWRHAFTNAYKNFAELVSLLHDRGIRGEIIDRTPSRFSSRTRGSEIREWLEDEAKEGRTHTYVILDDSIDGMEGYAAAPYGEAPKEFVDLRPKHVVTDWTGNPNVEGEEGGLQDHHVSMAISVLGGQSVCQDCHRQTASLPHYGNCLTCNGGFP